MTIIGVGMSTASGYRRLSTLNLKLMLKLKLVLNRGLTHCRLPDADSGPVLGSRCCIATIERGRLSHFDITGGTVEWSNE